MKIATVFVACVLMSASLTFGMSIMPSHPEWYDSNYHPGFKNNIETVPVIYKKVDSVLPFLFAVLLSQFIQTPSVNVTDSTTLAANGITVVTSNPCCG